MTNNINKRNNEFADAVILSYRREDNLLKVIRGLKRQSFVDKIYVFHNAPSKKRIKGVINIFSDNNHGCIARHSIALLVEKEYILFVDDDLELKYDFCKEFKKALRKQPYSIVGLFGVDVNTEDKSNNIYLKGHHHRNSKFERYVDLVKGRVHLSHKRNIIDAFKFFISNKDIVNKLGESIFNADDIILNLSSQLRTKTPAILLPCKKEYIEELPADHAVCSNNTHYENRSYLIKYFIKKGWVANKKEKKFFELNIKNGGNDFVLEEIKKYIKTKDLDNLKIFMKYIGNETENKLLIYNYAGILTENKKYNESLKLYSQVITGSEKNAYLKGLAYFKKGWIFFQQKKIKDAKCALKQALKIVPDHKLAKKILKNI